MTDQPKSSDIIFRWWRANIADRHDSRARALAAKLRRAGAVEMLLQPEVHVLAGQLSVARHQADVPRLRRLVSALAQIREHDPARFAERLGGEPPVLSRLRFERLLRSDGDEFDTALRRALPMIDRRCNVGALGADLLNWDHPEFGQHVRTRWCFQYFGSPAPRLTPETQFTDEIDEETA